MAVYSAKLGARTAVAAPGLATLAAGAYTASADIVHNTAGEPECMIEVAAATNSAPAGNKQLLVFARASLDGTTFTSGPSTGTDATDEADLYFVGVVPMASAVGTHRKIFSLADAFGGRLPHTTALVIKNDLGVALASGTVFRAAALDTIE